MTSPLFTSQRYLYARTFALTGVATERNDQVATERNDPRLNVREHD